jgi:hypothetical protein
MRRVSVCSLALFTTCVVPDGAITPYDPSIHVPTPWVDSAATCEPFLYPDTLWVNGVPYRQDLVGCR